MQCFQALFNGSTVALGVGRNYGGRPVARRKFWLLYGTTPCRVSSPGQPIYSYERIAYLFLAACQHSRGLCRFVSVGSLLAIPDFPGAECFGANATGGHGATVNSGGTLVVTGTLNRDIMLASGGSIAPRGRWRKYNDWLVPDVEWRWQLCGNLRLRCRVPRVGRRPDQGHCGREF